MSAAVTHRIGDLCEQVRGVTYSKADAVLSPKAGFKPVLRANNITERGLTFEDLVYVPAGRISAKQFVRQNDVVVAASSGSIEVVGKAARAPVDFDGGFGAFCKVLRPNGKVDPGYFAHFFQTQGYRRRVSALAAGANINNLRNEHLDDLEVALPSLAEQRRIAAILDKADALRTKRREAIAKLDQLLQSVFLDMFGDPVSNPKGIEAVALGELISLRTGKLDANASSEEGEYPFFTCAKEPLRISSYSYDCECVLVAGNGDLNVKKYAGKFDAYQRTYILESLDKGKLTTNYLYYFMDSYLDVLRKQSIGGIIKYIKKGNLTEAMIPLPAIEKQTAFNDACDRLLSHRVRLDSSARMTEKLFDVTQSQAFSGVP